MRRPLEGVRIADFTLHAAGPFCAHVLASLGAEVVKIESAMRPDIFRRPHPVYGRMEASQFEQVAANKLSITLNLKDKRAIALAKRFVATCDMVIESFRPGVMERLGLSYAELKKVKPEIVMVSISAYGQSGPDRTLPGYAPLFGAAGGLGYMTGYPDGPPVEIRHVMDHSVGMTGAFAAMAAVWQRRASGRGQHIDVAAREVASAFIGDALLQAAFGEKPVRSGNASQAAAPQGVYPCSGADAWIAIVVSGDREWRAFVESVGDARLLEPTFAQHDDRIRNKASLDTIIADWTRTRSAEAAAVVLQRSGVSACPSWNSAQLATDAHLRARGTIVDFGNDAQKRAIVGSLFHFSKRASGLTSGTPRLGEHNDRIFGDLLGLSEDERRTLERERVIY